MIERVIRASVENRVLVLFGALLLAIAGIVAVLKTPVDALPDLSDVQVIIKSLRPITRDRRRKLLRTR